MAEGNNKGRPIKNEEIDVELAIEAARELPVELLIRAGEILNGPDTKDEQELKIEELLKEMSVQANEIYLRKKQARANQ